MKIFDKIIPYLHKSMSSLGTFIPFSDMKIPLSSEHFNEIIPSTNGKIIFIDGGNGEILRSPTISLQFIRLAAIFYENNLKIKKQIKEFFTLVIAKKINNNLVFDCKVFNNEGDEKDSFEINALDPELQQGSHRISADSIGNHIRKLAELRFAKDLIPDLDPNSIIVRDGDLNFQGPFVKDSLTSLKSIAQTHKVHILGLSKTCSLCTDSGLSAIYAISSLAPENIWFYHTNNNLGFTKLHKNSKYTFRFDVFNLDKDILSKIFSLLSENAKDPVFLGYPFGLVEADLFARVSNHELNQFKIRFAAKFNPESLESALNAHDILNTL